MLRSLVAAGAATCLLSLTAACSSSADVAKDPTTSRTPSQSPTTGSQPPSTPTPKTPSPPSSPSTTADDSGRVSGLGFSFALPADWEDITASLKAQNPRLDVAVGEKNASIFRTNFNVVIATATTATIERDSDALRKQAASELKTVTKAAVTSLPDRTIDGETAIGQTSTFESSGTSVIFVQYVAIHLGKAYPLTLTFAESNSADAKAVLAGILDSWQWA